MLLWLHPFTNTKAKEIQIQFDAKKIHFEPNQVTVIHFLTSKAAVRYSPWLRQVRFGFDSLSDVESCGSFVHRGLRQVIDSDVIFQFP
jgi:hypothetical protein